MHHVGDWDFLMWVYGELDVELDRHARAHDELVLGYLGRLMPEKIRLPRHLYEELMDSKRQLVFDLVREELDLDEIAELVLLPVRVVEKIVRAKAASTLPV